MKSFKISDILNSFLDGVLIFDNQNNLLLINESAKKYLNINGEVVGKNWLELSDLFHFRFLYYLLGAGLKEVSKEEIEIPSNIILQVSSIPLFEKEKKIGKIILLHDITREKTIEKLKTEFVSVSAHQLRTPLASLRWTLEMLSKGNLNPPYKEMIEKGKTSTERMLRLVNELLDIVRIEEGKYLFHLKQVNFEEILNEAIDFYKEKIKEKGIQFQVKNLSKNIPKIKADEEKILLVLQNLLENAITYNLTGGAITITFGLKENDLFFSIEDTGIGIPESEQKNIFEKFFRASNAIKANTEGVGIGLFVAKNIIENHGGKIWFESKEGKGTTFYFTIPVK